MGFDVLITMPAVGPLEHGGEEVLRRWRMEAPGLAAMEHTSIALRAPERTGTLILSLTQEINPTKDVLARIYTDPTTQLAGPWHRVYAQYQEGPPLGHSTYTNGPRQYVEHARDEDTAQIRAWAIAAGQGGVADIVDAAEAGATTEEF